MTFSVFKFTGLYVGAYSVVYTPITNDAIVGNADCREQRSY